MLRPLGGCRSVTISKIQKNSFNIYSYRRSNLYISIMLALLLCIACSTITSADQLEIMPVPDQTVLAGNTVSFLIHFTGSESSAVTYAIEGKPDDASFNEFTGEFSWTPKLSDAGEHILGFSVSNEDESSTTASTITVIVNNPPEIQAMGPQSFEIGNTGSFQLMASDTDGDALTYSSNSLPSGSSLDPSSGYFEWKPESGQAGEYDVEFSVSDGSLSAIQVVNIKVIEPTPVSEPIPLQLGYIGPRTVVVEQSLHFTVSATGGNGVISFFTSELPSGATFDSSQVFEWRPSSEQVGTYLVEFIVSDAVSSVSEAVQITVEPADNIPDIPDDNSTVNSTNTTEKGSSNTSTDNSTSTTENGSSNTSTDNSTNTTENGSSNTSTDSSNTSVNNSTIPTGNTTNTSTVSPSGSSGGSGGSGGSTASQGSSSSSGIGGPLSTEKYENIEFKDYFIKYVLKDQKNLFKFSHENNSIMSVSIVTRLNVGETKVIIEMLNGTSTMVKKPAPGIVYRNVNIWVGDDASFHKNLIEGKVDFKVEKDWLINNSVASDSIELLRYSDTWTNLSTELTKEDEVYVYYTAVTPDFSNFAISSVNESSFATAGPVPITNGNNTSMSVSDIDLGRGAVAPQQKRSSLPFVIVVVAIAGIGISTYHYREQLNGLLSNLGNADGKRYRRNKR